MNEAIDNKISERIRTFSFLMTLVPAFYHCEIASEITGNIDATWMPVFNRFHGAIGVAAMSYFFFVSGFLLFHNLNFKTYGRKIRSRLFTLLIPYLVWQIIAWMNSWLRGFPISVREFLSTVFLFQIWPPDGALWYVYIIFLLALLSPVLLIFYCSKIDERILWVGILVLSVLIHRLSYLDLSGSTGLVQLVYSSYIMNTFGYLPCYLFGTFYGKFFSGEETASEKPFRFMLGMMVVAFLFDAHYTDLISTSFYWDLPILLLYASPVPRLLRDRKIYKVSFLIYAIHQPLYFDFQGDLITHVVWKISKTSMARTLLTRLFSVPIVIAAAVLIYYVLGKACPIALRVLTGGRAENGNSVKIDIQR